MGLVGFETFEEVETVQYYKNIKLDLGYPFSIITFKKEDFEECCRVISIKFFGGFNEEDNKKIEINKNKVINNEMFFWEDEDKINIFIGKYGKFLLDDNVFTIKLTNKNDYESILHTIIVPKDWAHATYDGTDKGKIEDNNGLFYHKYKNLSKK